MYKHLYIKIIVINRCHFFKILEPLCIFNNMLREVLLLLYIYIFLLLLLLLLLVMRLQRQLRLRNWSLLLRSGLVWGFFAQPAIKFKVEMLVICKNVLINHFDAHRQAQARDILRRCSVPSSRCRLTVVAPMICAYT